MSSEPRWRQAVLPKPQVASDGVTKALERTALHAVHPAGGLEACASPSWAQHDCEIHRLVSAPVEVSRALREARARNGPPRTARRSEHRVKLLQERIPTLARRCDPATRLRLTDVLSEDANARLESLDAALVQLVGREFLHGCESSADVSRARLCRARFGQRNYIANYGRENSADVSRARMRA